MRIALGLAALTLLLVGCGDDSAEAGAAACRTYADEMREDPEAVADYAVLPKIKESLADMDDPTRRAFAELLTAEESLMTNPSAADEAAAEVRTTCLAEHGVEVPAP